MAQNTFWNESVFLLWELYHIVINFMYCKIKTLSFQKCPTIHIFVLEA